MAQPPANSGHRSISLFGLSSPFGEGAGWQTVVVGVSAASGAFNAHGEAGTGLFQLGLPATLAGRD